MVAVSLSRREAETGEHLPKCCMRCGAPTDEYVVRTFAHGRGRGDVTRFSLVGSVAGAVRTGRRSMTVRVPICARHRSHWTSGTLVVVVLISALMFGIIGFYLYAMQSAPPSTLWPRDLLSQIILIGLILSIVPVSALALFTAPIYAKRIDRDAITLNGVSEKFVEELQRCRGDDGNGESPDRHS